MEYIVSARKYRPMTFDTVVGQSALTTTLKNTIATGKLAHAYLFCGPRGVGKTTCARIFARTINCMSPTADGEACGECESCKAFEEQRSFNIFELDAASNNSVEDIKTLMEQTRIPPQVGKYRVFIIDEVHMLSTAAFNAFLKTLEEPPAHVIFILATTEKHKLLPTIISRCQIYDFERMSVQNTINHLKMVADREGYTYEESALAVIAEKADGGMRDALSIFDQVASFCQGNITYDKVIEDLNVLDAENYFKIIDLALETKVSEIMVLLNGLIAKGFDAGNVSVGLASHVRNVMMAHDPSTVSLLETSEQQKQRYMEQAQRCPLPFLYQCLRILNQCDVQYKQSSNKRLLVELALIQVAQIQQPEDTPSSGRSPKRLKTLFKQIVKNAQSAQAAPQVAPTGKEQNSTATTVKETVVTASVDSTPTEKNMPKIKLGSIGMTFAKLKKRDEQAAEAAKAEKEEEVVEANVESFTVEMLQMQWLAMCNRIQLNPSLRILGSRMKSVMPEKLSETLVECVVDSPQLLDQMQPLRRRFEVTLQKALHNSEITLELRLAEFDEVRKVKTKAEILKEVIEMNPSVEKLIKELQLTQA